MRSGIMGHIVGDALGVPHEFMPRMSMMAEPATGMTGWGTHDQPPGTWSDDSSLLLCVLENCHSGGSLQDLGRLFLAWYEKGYHTPHGDVFDIGITTRRALERLRSGQSPSDPSGSFVGSDGNGSLMRCLPYAFFVDVHVGIDRMAEEGRITHPSTLCEDCCAFYARMARALAEGESKSASVLAAAEHMWQVWERSDNTEPGHDRRRLFQRLMDPTFQALEPYVIRSGGYVIETLEAAVWCLLNGRDYASSVLTAVNLGGDTDTVAALTGGLAGIYHGSDDIPVDWRDAIAGGAGLWQKIEGWLPVA